jgi:hypothetical protein
MEKKKCPTLITERNEQHNRSKKLINIPNCVFVVISSDTLPNEKFFVSSSRGRKHCSTPFALITPSEKHPILSKMLHHMMWYGLTDSCKVPQQFSVFSSPKSPYRHLSRTSFFQHNSTNHGPSNIPFLIFISLIFWTCKYTSPCDVLSLNLATFPKTQFHIQWK